MKSTPRNYTTAHVNKNPIMYCKLEQLQSYKGFLHNPSVQLGNSIVLQQKTGLHMIMMALQNQVRKNKKTHPNFSAYLVIISRMLSLYEESIDENFCMH